jgi:type VI secretion system secreted protein Hcp
MILLKLDGVDGDSQIKGYEKWIACTSVSWNIERTFSESAKAGTLDVNVGVADLPPVSLNKSFDCSSVYLMASGVAGGTLGENAKLHFLFPDPKGGEKPLLSLEIRLFNPIVASWSISGDEDERPTEEVSLWYWKIWMQYYTYDGKTAKSAGSKGWDRVANKSWTG